jgi:hypothetical protein
MTARLKASLSLRREDPRPPVKCAWKDARLDGGPVPLRNLLRRPPGKALGMQLQRCTAVDCMHCDGGLEPEPQDTRMRVGTSDMETQQHRLAESGCLLRLSALALARMAQWGSWGAVFGSATGGMLTGGRDSASASKGRRTSRRGTCAAGRGSSTARCRRRRGPAPAWGCRTPIPAVAALGTSAPPACSAQTRALGSPPLQPQPASSKVTASVRRRREIGSEPTAGASKRAPTSTVVRHGRALC